MFLEALVMILQVAAEPAEPVVLPPLLQKDPFWDTCLDSPQASGDLGKSMPFWLLLEFFYRI